MPRAKRANLAQKLATVALGAATLAIANAGQLPAQAAYGPPPPPPNAPGGYRAVVTSQTIAKSGGVIGPVHVDGFLVTLTIPAGTFLAPAQITVTAPTQTGIGAGGHPGYHCLGGVGVLVDVNNKAYTRNPAHQITLDISGGGIKSGDRVGEWNGSTFVFIASTERGNTERVHFAGSGDFAVFAPTGSSVSGPRNGSARAAQTTAVIRLRHVTGDAVLTSVFLTPVGRSPAGIGVLSREWLAASGR